MSDWKPKLKSGARFDGLNLTGEEGFVLSRLDGQTSLRDVTHVTGLPEGRIRQIIDKLVQHGAVEADRGTSAPGGRVSPVGAPPARKSTAQEELEAARAALLDDPSGEADLHPTEPTLDDQPALMTEDDPGARLPDALIPDLDDLPSLDDAPDTAANEVDPDAPRPEGAEEAQLDEPDPERKKADEASDGEAKDNQEQDKLDESQEANYRKLYETELSKLELPEREAMARSAKEPHLSALCFDAHPSVIKGVFENNTAGFQHARLVARHHRTPQGLDVVLNRAEFFRDTQTQRLMLANTMLQDAQLRKILGNKRLADIYKTTLNRDIPERNRQKARNILRTKWSSTEGEERAALVLTTEARCLMQLTGLPFDSKCTSILCSKTYNSTLMIQNLSRFAATPPNLLAHLARQALVRRMPQLRTMILQHPNCPSEVKRKG